MIIALQFQPSFFCSHGKKRDPITPPTFANSAPIIKSVTEAPSTCFVNKIELEAIVENPSAKINQPARNLKSSGSFLAFLSDPKAKLDYDT
jgi:hypothetical protein